jgi:hypothetical protein
MKVKHTIQSPGNEPVTYTYSRSGDGLDAIGAVASLLRMDYSDVPEKFRPVTIKIEIVEF